MIKLLTIVLPGFAANWVEVYADNPFYFLVFALIIWGLLSFGRWMERALRDESRRVWRETLKGEKPRPRRSWVKSLRTSPAYQRVVYALKWYVLPDWAHLRPLALVSLTWILFAAHVQASLPFLEKDGLCKPSPQAQATITRVSRDFHPKDVCSDSFGTVKAGERYVVAFDHRPVARRQPACQSARAVRGRVSLWARLRGGAAEASHQRALPSAVD